jgi:hypothetical protein
MSELSNGTKKHTSKSPETRYPFKVFSKEFVEMCSFSETFAEKAFAS